MTDKYPQMILNNGAHMKTWAEDLGGTVVGLHHIYLSPAGNMEEDAIIIGTNEMEIILKWMKRDRKLEHQEKMKQIIKAVE